MRLIGVGLGKLEINALVVVWASRNIPSDVWFGIYFDILGYDIGKTAPKLLT